jgi:hypothetical protein
MLILKPNSGNLLLRILAITFIIVLGFPFTNLVFQDPKIGDIIFWKIKKIHIIYFLILAMAFYIVMVLISIMGIIKVRVDTISDTISLISIFSKKTIRIKEIENYFWTTHKNSIKVFNGILLTLRQGKTIQLTGQNIKSISDFRDFLDDKKVAYAGEKKMKFPFN